ncbi:MAG: hypothetical protein PHQ96_03025, partial [Candidatus Omnitrophica bacterium]|nr:hypothetical protein [Candidatus Omnitrophota bacterium]
MMMGRNMKFFLCFLCLSAASFVYVYAQEPVEVLNATQTQIEPSPGEPQQISATQPPVQAAEPQAQTQEQQVATQPQQSLVLEPAKEQEGIIPVMKFKDADIRIVLQAIGEKASRDGKKINIVVSPKVEGLVSINLENIDWQTALEVVLKTYGYAYMRHKDVIIIASVDEIKERETQDRERQGVEAPQLKIFKLKYLDGNDAKAAILSLLSPVGRASVLELTGQAGWEFSTSTDVKADALKRERRKSGTLSRTKVLVVSDISRKLDEIGTLLKEIDVMPRQIVIRAKIMEVNRDLLRDIGIDWGTGPSGTSYATLTGRGFTQRPLGSENSG